MRVLLRICSACTLSPTWIYVGKVLLSTILSEFSGGWSLFYWFWCGSILELPWVLLSYPVLSCSGASCSSTPRPVEKLGWARLILAASARAVTWFYWSGMLRVASRCACGLLARDAPRRAALVVLLERDASRRAAQARGATLQALRVETDLWRKGQVYLTQHRPPQIFTIHNSRTALTRDLIWLLVTTTWGETTECFSVNTSLNVFYFIAL